MNTHDVKSAACVAMLMYIGLAVQGCGAPGKAIDLGDGVNSGDPCSVCKSPGAQGPDAGDLNNGDFTVFCNSPQCSPHGPDNAAKTVSDDNADVHETNESPSLCDICNRPDAQGPYAGDLNDDDFEIKCSQECPGFKHPGIALAAQQNSSAGAFILPVAACSFFVLMASLALKRFVIKKQPLLGDIESDDQYVRVVG